MKTPKNRSTVAALAMVSALLPAALTLLPRMTVAASSELVPVELVLLVDTSGSVDTLEYDLQRMGYADAFRDSDVARLIEEVGGVAVVYIEWSNTDHQSVRLPWRRLGSVEDCAAYATAIGQIGRETSGETMLAPALDFALEQLETNGFDSLKSVIDVSGDGRCENWEFHRLGILTGGHTEPEFYGPAWDDVIASMSGRVDVVNGICIGSSSELVGFYTHELPQGEGSFMRQVDDFEDFSEGIKSKLMREVAGIPGLYD